MKYVKVTTKKKLNILIKNRKMLVKTKLPSKHQVPWTVICPVKLFPNNFQVKSESWAAFAKQRVINV